MLDFTRYNELIEEEKQIHEAQEEELRRIGFGEEIDRLGEAKDIDGLQGLIDMMPNPIRTGPHFRAQRFIYQKIAEIDMG